MDPHEVLKGKFVKRVFKEQSEDIDRAIGKVIKNNSFQSTAWGNRSFVTSSSALTYTHLKRHRFVNMKRVRSGNEIINKRSYPIHNQIIYGHYNSIIRQLKYGFTTAVINELKNIDKID